MELTDNTNKSRIAIVVVGYNRIIALRRLLTSLLNAKYGGCSVPLYISIDASGDEKLYNYVKDFVWPYGDKYVNIQKERLGLRNHIIQCGDLTQYFRAIVMLEDDLFVSEYFYGYVLKAVAFYGDDERIGGISLYSKEMSSFDLPRVYMEDGSDTFLSQSPASWGQCWTNTYWKQFRKWYNEFNESEFVNIDMPEFSKNWKSAWTKYYQAYLVTQNRYFVYPYKSLTTCFGDPGTHSNSYSTYGQNSLVTGSKEYNFRQFEDMVKYDIYDVNESLYEWLGFKKEELYIDLYGYQQNTRSCHYLFTPIKLDLPIIKEFGLYMRPIELNVKYKVEGEGLYLYDLGTSDIQKIKKYKLHSGITRYFLRNYNVRMLINYATTLFLSILKNKILK